MFSKGFNLKKKINRDCLYSCSRVKEADKRGAVSCAFLTPVWSDYKKRFNTSFHDLQMY